VSAAEIIGGDWEAAFAPYGDETYQFVVERITPQDVVLDIGAGDLRLARRLATFAQHVYAVEKNAAVLPQPDQLSWPDRLSIIHEDALTWKYPADVTVAVLLMRHCTREHFSQIVQRLTTETQCQRLLTNARWKMNVEEVQIRSGEAYDPDRVGWYACRCGAVGFTPGDPQTITARLLADVSEVVSCPACGA
jgi:hypothetical protein